MSKRLQLVFFLYLSLFSALFFGCASAETTPDPVVETENQQPEPTIPEDNSGPEAEKQEEKESSENIDETYSADEPYIPSEEEYNETFSDVKSVIEELNTIISDKDFEKWKNHLTEPFIDFYSSPATLLNISSQPRMEDLGINLRTLKDYFLYVVVASRLNARLDEIEFVDENNVKAKMIIGGTPYLLYNMKRVDGQWKIGL